MYIPYIQECPFCKEKIYGTSGHRCYAASMGNIPYGVQPNYTELLMRKPTRVRRTRVPDCPTCADPANAGMMPPHDASIRCESGGHSHCSCDTCF